MLIARHLSFHSDSGAVLSRLRELIILSKNNPIYTFTLQAYGIGLYEHVILTLTVKPIYYF
jgi:hypothetical protein